MEKHKFKVGDRVKVKRILLHSTEELWGNAEQSKNY